MKEDNPHNKKYLKEKRRQLRNHGTSAEATLWRFLQKRELDGRKFRRQHSVGNYILDFYCPSEQLAIELGGAHHYTSAGFEADQIRDKYLETHGIKTLRFENREVFENLENLMLTIKPGLCVGTS